jgi:ATP-dependent helicase/nuclease subunit B
MGNLLHGVFLDFMLQLQEAGERPGEAHQARLQELIEAAVAAQRERVPVTLEAGYRNDCRRIERAARIFLHAEAQRLAADPALQPAAFELEFGFDPEHPVEVRQSHEIWDYKTGSTFGYSATDLLQGGLKLQWALYAYALPHLVDGAGDVRLSGYFFASDRGSGQRFSDAPPARHELAQALRPLFDLARQGFFPALHKSDARGGGPCRFCDYRRVCATEARGADQVDDLFEEAAQLSALVEGWVETVSAGSSGSRRSLEATFDALGLAPTDVAPQEAARSARDWIRA